MEALHLMIDAVCSVSKMKDEKLIQKILRDLPPKIGMRTLIDPITVKVDNGISGIVIIDKSHISIHTFIDKQFSNIDVFSCKLFDVDKVIKYFRNKLDIKQLWTYTVSRNI